MAFKVFISHSTGDLGVVYRFSDSLQMNGIPTYVAELYPQPGIQLPAKVENGINWSDCVVAIMTKDGDRSAWVNQEIGYAKKANKLIVPIVENGVEPKGFISELEYITFIKESPELAIAEVTDYLVRLKANKEQQDNLKAGLFIFFGVLALAAISKK